VSSSSLDIVPMTGALGAELMGVDLSAPLDDSVFEAIHAALLDYQVICFREQTLSPAQHLAFATRFGEPGEYPFAKGLEEQPEITEIVKEPHEHINFGGEWHSDTTYLEVPPKLTTLYARQTPETGGDTLFANMYLGYDALSPGLKAALESVRAEYTAALLPRINRDGYATMQGTNVDKLDMSALHPVIRTHPETRRKSLYVNETHTRCLEEMSPEESRPLIEYVCQQAVRPEHCCRLQWRPGTFTIWDNRCTQHFAINDYHGARRVMHRLTIKGDKPH